MLKEERNARIEIGVAILVIALGFWLQVSPPEWCLIIICIGALLSAEAMNTSIERLSDYASPGWNDKIRDVKDIAAGSVFVISIIGSIIGLIIFIPKIIFRFF